MRAAEYGRFGNNALLKLCTLIRITLYEQGQQLVAGSNVLMKLCTLIRNALFEWGTSMWSFWQQCTYEVMQAYQNHPLRIRAAACGLVGNNVLMKLCTLIRITLNE